MGCGKLFLASEKIKTCGTWKRKIEIYTQREMEDRHMSYNY
jgi:hypothetical protein